MLKIRRPLGRLIFNMGIAIPGKTVFLIETAPWSVGSLSAQTPQQPSVRRYLTAASAQLPWWRHKMETFSALLALCAGNSPLTGEFPAQRPVTRSFDVFFDLHLNKHLSKQSRGWWFEMSSCWLWRHRNATVKYNTYSTGKLSSSRSGGFVEIANHRYHRSNTSPSVQG